MNATMGACVECGRNIVLIGTTLCPSCEPEYRTCYQCGVKKHKDNMYIDATHVGNSKREYTWFAWLCGKCSLGLKRDRK